MKFTASAGRFKVDIREHCYKLNLTASVGDDSKFLAALYQALVWNKLIVIDGQSWGLATVSPTPPDPLPPVMSEKEGG